MGSQAKIMGKPLLYTFCMAVEAGRKDYYACLNNRHMLS
jgi:hypothetical protein